MHCRGGFDAGRTIKLRLACLLFSFLLSPLHVCMHNKTPNIYPPLATDTLHPGSKQLGRLYYSTK